MLASGAIGRSFDLITHRKCRRRIMTLPSGAVAPIVQPTSLDEVCYALRRNQLTELKIGWKESDFLQSRRAINMLERALRINKSVTSVSVGYRHRSRSLLVGFLRILAWHTDLTSLQIVLNHTWIPEQCLKHLLQRQRHLVTLELRAVKVLRKHPLATHYCCSQDDAWLNPFNPCDHSLISRVLVHLNDHDALKSLSLVDCDVNDRAAVMLADLLHIRGGVARLSLRGNSRFLGPHGLKVICQAPVMERLDLSLCDLDFFDAQAIAQSIGHRPWPLGELLLCGNYRMDVHGLEALTVQACCDKLVGLNVSHCDIGPYKALRMIESLQKLHPKTTLQRIIMQGSRVSDPEISQALCRLLQVNDSLRVVWLDDPMEPKNMSTQQLSQVMAGLRGNYEMEDLRLDSLRGADEALIRRDMDFVMRLNRAGRRVLRQTPLALVKAKKEKPHDEWFDVLEKAGEDLDVLYWMVREGADRFSLAERRRMTR